MVATAKDHPGSQGDFSGQKMVYDVMGRVIKVSNPTEITATSTDVAPSQLPIAGVDKDTGWIYTLQTYDWKGRPRITTKPSVTTNSLETTTIEISYWAVAVLAAP